MYIYSALLFVIFLFLFYRNRNILIFAKLKISYAIPCGIILCAIFYYFTHTFELGDYILLLFISPLYLINIIYIIVSSILILYFVSKSTGIGSYGIFVSIFPAKSTILWNKINSIQVVSLEKKIVVTYFDENDKQIAKNSFNPRVLPYIEQKFTNLNIICKYI